MRIWDRLANLAGHLREPGVRMKFPVGSRRQLSSRTYAVFGLPLHVGYARQCRRRKEVRAIESNLVMLARRKRRAVALPLGRG